MGKVFDQLNRPLEEIRISLIDKCNYRCTYCMPGNKTYQFAKADQLLTSKQIEKLIKVLIPLGLKSIRLTGGEPLLRRDICSVIEVLQKYDLDDISLTTNGQFLSQWATSLQRAGLRRITVSLDALDQEGAKKITGGKANLSHILAGIQKAKEVNLPIKINCLTYKGFSEERILPLVDWAIGQSLPIRFIEYMDVGNQNDWASCLVLTSQETRGIISQKYSLVKQGGDKLSSTSENYLINGKYQIGFISSISKPFCKGCNRVRISSQGKLFLCLFAEQSGFDLMPYLNDKTSDEKLQSLISSIWKNRNDRYSLLRWQTTITNKVEMFHIGG